MRYLAVLFAVIFALGAAERADAVTLNFSFTNAGNGGGTVQGVVRGLLLNQPSRATSVEVTANSLGFGVGEYIGLALENSFQVNENGFVSFNFLSTGALNAAPAVRCCSLAFVGSTNGNQGAGLSNNPNGVLPSVETGFSIGLAPGPAPVPLPAPLLLLVSALVGLAGVGRLGRRGNLRGRS